MIKKLISLLTAMSLLPTSMSFTAVVAETKPDSALWDKFIKYDLCITDYDSLTDEQQGLCQFIFETEQSSEDTIVCERARRILSGYDVGRRVTLEDTEKYYDFADFSYMYNLLDSEYYETPYLCAVPDIKHIDSDVVYNEYWLDESGNKKILSTGEAENTDKGEYLDVYKYVEQDDNGNVTKNDEISRRSIHYKTIKDEDFTYAVYPDNTLYVLNPNNHVMHYDIPEEVNGMSVVGIKKGAFQYEGCYDINFPDSIEYIEPVAFLNCDLLESITLPKNLKYLGRECFASCHALKSITIDCPDLICGSPVFSYCSADSVFLNYKYITSSMLSTFQKVKNVEFGGNVVKLGTLWTNERFINECNYIIPNNVKAVSNDVFSFYHELYSEALVVPESVEIFGAYSDANNKASLIPNTVISGYTGSEAERYAEEWGLEFVTIGEYVSYGDANCDSNVSLADSVLVLQTISNPDVYGVDGTNENHITELGMVNADVYEVGSGLTPQDALSIQKYMLKLISELPE